MTYTIDDLCRMTTRPSTLNALHACRPGHPLGGFTRTPWNDALWAVSQNPDFAGASVEWVRRRAATESEN